MMQIESEKDDEIRAHKIAQSIARNGNDMTTERTRELLENCAKACGIPGHFGLGGETMNFWREDIPGVQWSPLTSSADEAEMEAKLRLDVKWFDDIECVSVGGKLERYSNNPTPQLARMMAGCRAAEAVYLERGK